MTMRKSALLASTLAVTLMACGGRDFNKPSLLDKPRILAVKAEPPQPSFGQTTTLSTLLYQPPLDRVADKCPNPSPVDYIWEWCPISMIADAEKNKYTCPFPEEGFQAMYAQLGLGEPPPYLIGKTREGVPADTVTFTNPFPAPLLAALCQGSIGASLGGAPSVGVPDGGARRSLFNCDLAAEDVKTTSASETHPVDLKITISVTVTPACPGLLPEGFSPLQATFALHLPTNDAIPNNQNPALDGIFVTENWTDVADASSPPATGDEGGADGGVGSVDGGEIALDGGEQPPAQGHNGPDGSVPLEEEPLVKVKRDKHVGLQLDLDIGAAEHLAVPGTIDFDSASNLTRHYEHLALSWYAEAGDFTGQGKGGSTGYLPAAVPPGQDGPPSEQDITSFQFNTTNNWDLPKHQDYEHDTARVIVVVRDGRGGVGWTSRQVSLEATP
jgi:hypothetical protein